MRLFVNFLSINRKLVKPKETDPTEFHQNSFKTFNELNETSSCEKQKLHCRVNNGSNIKVTLSYSWVCWWYRALPPCAAHQGRQTVVSWSRNKTEPKYQTELKCMINRSPKKLFKLVWSPQGTQTHCAPSTFPPQLAGMCNIYTVHTEQQDTWKVMWRVPGTSRYSI